ncbi:apolipoprotein B-100 isoform X1 [Pipistrellus kuhlii]|uniref:Apolipoprotein B n=1 Tax=Pipistrellus kuhlii TaxID=59472 RepID=A0A7J7VU21_PIPKU|nr:apolipoprotein B-100 isoform X1 [Pipistrellus kuhlii]KAF6328510.1 apolipoprotein B [Pipistrellus kuhlii]
MGPSGPALLALLLLMITAGAQSEDEVLENANPSCAKGTTRFKHLRKYVYSYEAESSSGAPTSTDSRSVTKINCKVELEVPQLCSFILKTSQCTLKEAYGFSPEGQALLKKSKSSEEFSAAMAKFELRLATPEGKQVLLYPDKEEPKHILNIKRGIISALLVPSETEEDKQVLFLDTVYGNCSSDFTVKARKGNVATEVSIERNLEKCDHFQPVSTGVSPLALIKGLTRPLSTQISSSQSCQYTLDPKRKHVSEATCQEQHLFLPLSHENKYGMMAQVTQTLKLEDTPKINSRFFDEGTEEVGLTFETTKSTSPPKQAEAIVKTLQELQKLHASEQNAQRAKLFSKLVTELRGLNNEAVSSLLPKLVEVSSPITLQALIQCGQPQCYTHILQWLRNEKANPLLIDVVTYLVALIPGPSVQRLQEIFITAKEQQSRATFYALSHVIHNYHKTHPTATQELMDIADYLVEQIQDDCTGNEDRTYLSLRVIGNIGGILQKITPRLTSSVLQCVKSTAPSLLIQKAAIQALRKMENKDEVREVLLQTFLDGAAPGDKRLAAYLMLMRDPSQSDVSKITQLLPEEQNEQVKNFVASHIANILNSNELYVQSLKELVKEALKDSQLPTVMDFRKFSRNYHFSKSVSLPSLTPFSTKIESNLIFDPNNYLPKESMLKTTLTVFGLESADLFELGLEGKGFEPTLEALFGKQGFFPDSVNKALYWVDSKIPDRVSETLVDHFGFKKDDKREQDMVKGIMVNVEKLIKDLKSKEFPEARAYLRILGEELGFVRLEDLQLLGKLLLNGVHILKGIPQMIAEALKKGSKNDLFLHYIFMDNAFEFPTGLGLPLQVSSSGVITPGIQAGMKLEVKDKMQMELVAKPSVSVEFVTNMGIVIPDFARNGVQMNTNFFHEMGLEARVGLSFRHLKFSIPAPKRPVKLLSVSNTMHLVSAIKELTPPLTENRNSWSTCKPFFTGLNYCTTGTYSNTSSYFPLIGDTSIFRYELELQPTGEVEQYSASAIYNLQKEGKAQVDTLEFVAQAEGVKQTEATMTIKYNRQTMTLTSETQIPDFDIDLGTVLKVTDESAEEKTSYKLTIDIQNKKITEVAFTGHISYDKMEEGKIKGVLSIPRLQAEARSEALAQWTPTKLLLQMDSSATAYGSTISEKLVWRYDEEKIEFEWNTGTNVDTKKAASSFPVDLSDYSKRLHMYANSLLDHRVPKTDKTFRHVGSKLIDASNTWFQKAFMHLPYAKNVQDYLKQLKQKLALTEFHIPENLFLNSDGRVKYTFNENSVKIEIPLPLGGKSSKDLKMLETVQRLVMSLPVLGFYQPPQEYQLPNFTVPKLYELRVPHLGVLDLSANIYSNLYNWSASYTGGNTSTDHFSLQARYHMKADSAVDLLSYSVQGSGETTYDHRNTFTLSCSGSLHHKLLDSNVKFSHVEKMGNNPASKGLLTFDASSVLGPQMSASVHLDSKQKEHLYIKEVKIDGQFRVSSLYANGAYGLSYQKDPTTGQRTGESNLKFNSTYLQGTNQIIGRYEDGTFTLTSSSDLQDGIIKNTASLKYENYELTVKSDTNGQYEDFATSNKVDLAFSTQKASLRSEYQADYRSLRFFTLLSGSLNAQGLELNADILGTDKINTGAHKATLQIGRDGMSTSATTNLKYSPLMLENELNAALGLSGASVKLTTNGRFREHNAKFSLDGKAALTEVSLGSAYQAMILGVDSKNIFNFKMNQEGLKLSNDMMGSYAEMKLHHIHSLNIAGLSLDFSSKLDNIYSSDKSYKQTFNLQLQPYSLVTTLNNDLEFSDLDVTNHAKLQLEPLKLNVGGNIKGAYGNDEIKHIYTLSYADLSASYKADTVAKVQNTEFSHRLSTNIAGLASTTDISTSYNSDSLHFSNVFHSVMAPFTMTVDVHTISNGKLVLWGEHTGQLYSKFLLKAEPLSLTFSHDYTGSTSHRLKSKRHLITALEHKVGTLLTPAEQTATWKLKTQVNKNEYTQEFDAYNTKDKIGMDLTGRALADLTMLDSPVEVPLVDDPVNVIDALEIRDTIDQPQEFTMVASVKYDKNQDVHTMNLPFFNLLPEHFEKSRIIIINALEAIQRELKYIDIDQFVMEYRTALDKLSQLNEVNWETQVSRAKEKLTAFIKNYGLTENDLKIALDNAQINFNEKLSQLQTYVIQVDQYIKDNYDLHDFKATIAKIIDQIIENLKILDEHYHIRVNLVKVIHNLYLFIENIDFNKVGSNTVSWIQNVTDKYQIRIWVQEKLQQLKTQIQNIDMQHFAEKLKQQVEAIDVRMLLDQLKTAISFKKIKQMIEHVKNYVRNFIEDFEVTEKINAFRNMVLKLINMYKIEQHIQFLMDKSVQLAQKYKLKETLQRLGNVLKQVGIKDLFEKLVGFIDDAVTQLKALSFNNFIEEVNRFLDVLIKQLRSFNYHQFIDETNNKIREVSQRINGEIQALDLPRKAKALKEFVEDIKNVLSVQLENLKNTKITFFIDWLQEALRSPSLNYMKAKFQETLEDIRDQLYQMDLQQKVEQYLFLVGQIYDTIVTYISDSWSLAIKILTEFAEEYSVQGWAENLKALVEQGFIVPEIKTIFGTMPAFEVSLRVLREATYQTPEFIVPLTDLKVPSVKIDFKKLEDIKVPSRFSTPEFTVLDTFYIPSFTIDLVEIKAKIIRIIDQMLNSELQWPVPEVYLRDLMDTDTILARITLPDFHISEITIPEFVIPRLDLKDFQIPDLHIPEFQLPKIPQTIQVPTFGKLHSVLKIQSPLFTLDANADIHNVTTSVNEAGITASINAKGHSKLEVLKFDLQANAQLLYPKMKPLILKESVSFSSKYLNTEHKSEVLFFENAIEGKSNTVAGVQTEKNTMELSNGVLIKINSNQINLDSNTKYFHKLHIPKLDFSSQANLHEEIKALWDAQQIAWTSSGRESWKLASPKFSDEGTRELQISFTLRGPLTSFEFSNKINSKHLRLNQTLAYESRFLDHYQLEIQSQVESQHVGHSILTAKGTAQLGERKIEVTGNHDAQLNGKVSGSLKNSLFFLAVPFEITASTNNEGNLKVIFPLKLTGKIDFLNNYALFLSPNAQQASWQASARFNQYKYNQNFSAGNNENSTDAHIGLSGEANLDFLNSPLTIPEMTLPYTGYKIPQVKDFSLWERTGLKEFLKTTKQSFDLSVKAQYKKNKDKHSIPIPLDTFCVFINRNIKSFNRHFEKVRGKALYLLTKSYNEAKRKLDKYTVEKSLNKGPITLQIPGYTIPVINTELSPFTAKMWTFGFEVSTPNISTPNSDFYVPSYAIVLPSLGLPALKLPRNFLKFSLPELKVLTIPNILIPAMGNLTYDFSFKSSVITLNTNVGLYNQSDIVAQFLSSSSSVIDALQYKLEGTSSLTRKRGLKLATALSLSNQYVEGNHDSTISLTTKTMEASVTTTANVQIPILRMNFKQELNGNTKSKPTVSSSIELKYDFNSTKLHSTATGTVDHKFSLESLTSYFSIELANKGDIQGSVLSREYSGMIAEEVSTYLNSKGTRSSVKLQGASKVDRLWNLEVKESFAGEASLRRIYATWEHNTKNHFQLMYPLTSGEHSGKATLELSPWKMSALAQVHASQLSFFLDLKHLGQEMSLNVNPENQKASWKGEIQVDSLSLQNDVQLSNDQDETRLDIAGSLEGYLSFLDSIALPVYDKTLWEFFKLDVTTSKDRKQYFHASTALVYTKNPKGYTFSVPVQELADKFVIPGLRLNNLNSVLLTPAFIVPFTDLHVPPYTLDFSEIKIYKKLHTSPFALNVPALPKVKFPEVDVLTKYSGSEESSVPFFEITVPGFQLTMPQFTYPNSISVGATVLDLNEMAGQIADFRFPNITIPDQTIEIPSIKFSIPAGIYIPSFGALTARFGVASPLYNATWNAGLKNKDNHVETFLNSTCSSIMQFLEYDLKVMGTYKIEDGMFVYEGKGTFTHRDINAEYEEDAKLRGYPDWKVEFRLDITSPAFTDVHIHCRGVRENVYYSAASPAIGMVALDLESDNNTLTYNVYYRPQSSPDKNLSIFKIEFRHPSSESNEKFQMKVNWEKEAVSQLLSSLKDNVPKATGALFNYVNKCHQEYTGLNLREASLKLRRSLQNKAEETYQGALILIDKVDKTLEFKRVTRDAARTYQLYNDRFKILYQGLLDEEGNIDLQKLQNKVLNILINITREWETIVRQVISWLIDYLKLTRFHLPGRAFTNTADELSTLVMRGVGKVLLQVHSKIHNGLEILFSYVQDLMEKSELIKDLKIKSPFDSRSFKLTNVTLEYGKQLNSFSQMVQRTLNAFKTNKTTVILGDLQRYLEGVFEYIREKINHLKRERLPIIIQNFKHEIKITFDSCIQYVSRFLKENLNLDFDKLNDLVQNKFQEASQELEQLHQYIKALCKEYLDSNVVSWRLKYYEFEGKMIDLVKKLVHALKDFHSKYIVNAAGTASQLYSEAEQLVQKAIQKYLSILVDADGKGKEKAEELYTSAQEIIKSWTASMKEIISDYHQQFKYILENFSDRLSDYYEKFIAEIQRLIDLSIQTYHLFLIYIIGLLEELKSTTVYDISRYLKIVPGELTVAF